MVRSRPLPSQITPAWCTSYCYGFRVPLLVLSAYTPAGYVDNNTHDFGSILKFVEKNFDLGLIGSGTYADAYADDLSAFFTSSQSPWAWIAAPKAKFTDNSDPDDDRLFITLIIDSPHLERSGRGLPSLRSISSLLSVSAAPTCSQRSSYSRHMSP